MRSGSKTTAPFDMMIAGQSLQTSSARLTSLKKTKESASAKAHKKDIPHSGRHQLLVRYQSRANVRHVAKPRRCRQASAPLRLPL